MGIDFSQSELTELSPKITVIGVGGAGGNAVNNMITAQLQGVDFVVANTDAQALASSQSENRIQLGVEITQGLGAGAQPRVGEAAAEEASSQIENVLSGVHMAFITAGMGGGTGTGAAPVVARLAREKGILTVGVVTRPFQFEGARRMKMADAGIKALAEHVDTLIIIPNQNLFCLATEKTTFADAFKMADEVLHSGVRGITDLMVTSGLINLDFADVKTVMSEMGKAMMGTGEADGPDRASEAAQAAIANPLLEDVSLRGARAVIVNITGGMDMTLHEVDEAANLIRSQVDPDANIIIGSAFNQDLEGKLRVSVVATGIEGADGTLQTFQKVEQRADHTTEDNAISDNEAAKEHVEATIEADPETINGDTANIDEDQQPLELENILPQEGEYALGEEASAELEVHQSHVMDDDMANNPSVSTSESSEVAGANNDDDFDEEALVASRADSVFVAAPPKEPSLSITPTGMAEGVADNAYSSAGDRVELEGGSKEEQKSGGLSFFRKLTGSSKGDDNPFTSPGQNAGSSQVDSKLEEKSDQLEIPSFLRRQSN